MDLFGTTRSRVQQLLQTVVRFDAGEIGLREFHGRDFAVTESRRSLRDGHEVQWRHAGVPN